LKECGKPSQIAEEFVADIFGKRSGSSCEEGLVDSTSPEDFNARLKNCKDTNTREALYAPAGCPPFYSYFVHYKAHEVCYSMGKMSERLLGLGLHLGYLLPMHQKA